MSKTRGHDALLAALRAVDHGLRREGRLRLLEAIAWPRSVEERFFASGARALPEVEYEVDRDAMNARVAELDALHDTLPEAGDPIGKWLRATVASMRDANRLVLAAGTAEFHRVSRGLYGSARTRFHGEGERNVDLADHVLDRLRVHGWDEARDPEVAQLDDVTFAAGLRTRLAATFPAMQVEVVIDPDCAAKVIAGMSRVRVRKGATFTPWEADGLWHHEIETHALTAHNGALQPNVPFLRAGGPRATRTQEGLAVFSELYHHALSVSRLERLATRVKLVDMAEQGADFLELYRHRVAQGAPPRDAWLDAQRVCRGGLVTGGAPFTKDAAYLAGLLDVHAFLTVVMRGGFRDEMELLVAGRVALEDVHALVLLRREGVLQRPRYIPAWLARWDTLLPHFAFTSFLDTLDLASLRERYRALIDDASAIGPPDEPAPEF